MRADTVCLQLMVAVPQPGDEVDGTSPFSPSPFDGEQAAIFAAGSSTLLPSSAVSAPVSHGPGRTIPRAIDTSEQIDVGEGDASTDSFSPTSAGPTPPKVYPSSPFYSHQDAVRAPASVSVRTAATASVSCWSPNGLASTDLHEFVRLRRRLCRCLGAHGMSRRRMLTARTMIRLGHRSLGWAR